MVLYSSLIKWTGSKRPVAAILETFFPETMDTYYEPFVGSGALLPYHHAQFAIAGDVIKPLIEIWTAVKEHPQEVIQFYTTEWTRLQADPNYYYSARERFNTSPNGLDLLFLTRTSYSGLIRFNRKGEFNAPFHFGRPGIHPKRFESIVYEWCRLIQNATFVCDDYRNTLSKAKAGDFAFIDPPYVNSRAKMYQHEQFNHAQLWETLEDLNRRGVLWLLTIDQQFQIPPIYKMCLRSAAKNSSYRRLKGQTDHYFYDQVYINYEKPMR